MSSPGPLGSARPARLVGFALLGVAIVAAGIGVFALTGNSSGGSAQGRPPTPPSSQSQPVLPTTANPPPTTATTTTRPPTPTTYPSGQTTTVVPPPPTTGGQVAFQQVPVRVYNNSTIKGLAATAANQFRNAGFDVVDVGNYPQGVIDASTAYYSPAPGERETATALAQDFGMKVAPRFPGIAFASAGVIVIITNDFQAVKK